MLEETIFEYEIDYEKAKGEAKKIAEKLCKKYPYLEYRITTRLDEGVFVKLYGEDEELIRKIADSMWRKEQKLLLAGTPVYITYGGKKNPW